MALPLEQVARQRPGVHVAWFGLRNPDLTIAPLRLLGASYCYLLELPNDAARQQIAAGGHTVEELFEEAGVKMRALEVDLWDAGCVAGTIGAICSMLQDAAGHSVPVHVNVCAGPRPAAIGAGLAATFWDVHLFHPRGENPAEVLREATEAVELPCLKATLPGPVERLVLAALQRGDGKTDGPAIKSLLRNSSKSDLASVINLSSSAEHNRLMRAADKLENLGALKRPTTRRLLRVEATPAGLALARMFEQYDQIRELLADKTRTAGPTAAAP